MWDRTCRAFVRQIDDVLKEAPDIAALLGDDAAVEKGWIAQLTELAVPLRSAVDASGAAAASSTVYDGLSGCTLRG